MRKYIIFKGKVCLLLEQIDKNEYRCLYDDEIVNVFKCHDEEGNEAWGEVLCDKYVKLWRLNGELHREDGPAIECKNDLKYWYKHFFSIRPEYWIHGCEYSKKEYLKRINDKTYFL